MKNIKYTILFLQPIVKTKLWAGNKLSKKIKNYGANVGEVWLCSALADNSNIITNLSQKVSLQQFWLEHKGYFGFADHINNYDQDFPLLVKFIDAGDNLSVQLHPNYKNQEQKYLNKNEAWYIIDCANNGEIIYGHNANNLAQFQQYVANADYSILFNLVKIANGQVWYIPSGSLHAIMADTLILEVQQPSDITYRLYDYDRLDHDGKLRQLHLAEVEKHLSYNQQELRRLQQRSYQTLSIISNQLQLLLSNNYFSIYRVVVYGNFILAATKQFYCLQILSGSGQFLVKDNNNENMLYNVRVGESILILNTVKSITIMGYMMIMLESPLLL